MEPLSLLVALPLVLLSVPLVHEGAHAFSALALGARGVRLRVREGRALAPRVEADLAGASRARAAVFYAAGCAANLGVSFAACVLVNVTEASPGPLVLTAAFHALYGALNLWPFAEGTDGRALWHLRGRSR